jgi:uncharacterized phage infection (PIP) family protein YhgE
VSSISSSIAGIIASLKKQNADPAQDPAKALKRLDLAGKAHSPYIDVIHFSTSDIGVVVKTMDDERDHLEEVSARAKEAADALDKAADLLGQAGDLAKANVNGAGRSTRRSNQKKIDDLMSQLADAFAKASDADPELFAGRTTLTAGDASVELGNISLDSLGRQVLNGRVVSLKDVRSKAALDSAGHHSSATGAMKAIASATQTVTELRDKLQDFASKDVRPRVGDLANAIAGIYTDVAPTLGSSEEALKVARELRDITLGTSTDALAVGADGWDRQRILDLLTPQR